MLNGLPFYTECDIQKHVSEKAMAPRLDFSTVEIKDFIEVFVVVSLSLTQCKASCDVQG